MTEEIEIQSEQEDKPKRIKTYDFGEVTLQGRTSIDEPSPNTGIVVIPSPEGHVVFPGTKCSHGGYIPSTHPDRDRAPYCSICYPYLLSLNEQES